MDNEPAPRGQPASKTVIRSDRLKSNQRRTWLIVAIVAAALAGVLLASSLWTGSWKRSPEADRRAEIDERVIAPEKQCALQSTYDSIKRALFARAARARGSDEAAFAKLSDFSLLRIESPVLRGVDEDLDRINCNGVAVLQLPPGVRVSDGGSTLSAPLDYAVQPAADGTGNVVMLGNADAITTPLATIQRSATTSQPGTLAPPDMDPVTDGSPAPAAPPTPAPAPQPQPQESASPSFNCGNARTRGEIAVCNDSGLAALDRQMASQFNSALQGADPRQERLLQSTRSGFLAFRDRCRSDQCIADTYRGRMREISDIMAGRWNPRR
jgi:uncharacterized protein YecT (DUF1311 family)